MRLLETCRSHAHRYSCCRTDCPARVGPGTTTVPARKRVAATLHLLCAGRVVVADASVSTSQSARQVRQRSASQTNCVAQYPLRTRHAHARANVSPAVSDVFEED